MSRVNLAISRDGEEERIVVTGILYYTSVDRLAKHLRSTPAAKSRLDLGRLSYCDVFAMTVIESIRSEPLRCGGELELTAWDGSNRVSIPDGDADPHGFPADSIKGGRRA